MNYFLIIVLSVVLFFGCQVKVKTASDAFNDDLMNVTSIRSNLEFLSSDELEGREAGSRGAKVASKFIASELKKYGVKPFRSYNDYFQNINLRVVRFSDQSSFSIVNNQGQLVLDFEPEKHFVGSTRYHDIIDTTAKIVFAGYGITAEEYNYDDYANLDVEGKIVLLYQGEPESDDSTFFKGEKRTTYSSLLKKNDMAAEQGALALIVMIRKDNRYSWDAVIRYVQKGKYLLKDQPVVNSMTSIPYIAVNEETFSQLIDLSSISYQELKKQAENQIKIPSFEFDHLARIQWSFDTTGTIGVRNVIGIVEGIDPALKNEYIGIGAHYDHLGLGSNGVYNGADDNGSGTVALLEIAKTFAKIRDNKRSILFTFHTAEEKGLLGSKFLVRDSSITNNMIAHINMDMIGRGSSDSIYCLGSDKLSSEYFDLIANVNSEGVGIYLDYSLNDPGDPLRLYYRSDHYSYARKNIPSVFFFDYEMEDYHRVTDDFDKINFKKIQKVARLVYEVALGAANRKSRFRLDNNKN
jgi:Zn-dependent M28 family amino/carboxypeptidase